jgi:hypothetical protein
MTDIEEQEFDDELKNFIKNFESSDDILNLSKEIIQNGIDNLTKATEVVMDTSINLENTVYCCFIKYIFESIFELTKKISSMLDNKYAFDNKPKEALNVILSVANKKKIDIINGIIDLESTLIENQKIEIKNSSINSSRFSESYEKDKQNLDNLIKGIVNKLSNKVHNTLLKLVNDFNCILNNKVSVENYSIKLFDDERNNNLIIVDNTKIEKFFELYNNLKNNKAIINTLIISLCVYGFSPSQRFSSRASQSVSHI